MKGSVIDKIPTLEKDVYRKASPMLQELYAEISFLLNATHGDWLSIDQMKALWKINETDNTRTKDMLIS